MRWDFRVHICFLDTTVSQGRIEVLVPPDRNFPFAHGRGGLCVNAFRFGVSFDPWIYLNSVGISKRLCLPSIPFPFMHFHIPLPMP